MHAVTPGWICENGPDKRWEGGVRRKLCGAPLSCQGVHVSDEERGGPLDPNGICEIAIALRAWRRRQGHHELLPKATTLPECQAATKRWSSPYDSRNRPGK
jgi:hypothetical protein